MYLGIFSKDNRIYTEKFCSKEAAVAWMYGKMMTCLKEDSCCMSTIENYEGYIRFLGGGDFLIEDDESMMGEGMMLDNEVIYDACYGHSFTIRIVDLGTF